MADPSYIVDGVLTDGEAWVALNSKTLTSDTVSITFTSGYNDAAADVGGVQAWDQYMDLVAISYWRSAFTTGSAYEVGWCFLNGDTTTTNYKTQLLYGDGSSVTASNATTYDPAIQFGTTKSATATIFSCCVSTWLDINSGKFKSSVHQGAGDQGGTSGWVSLAANTWKNQAAITSLQFRMENGSIKDESRIDLFGVLPRMVA
jgi:hypothetical protein